ncbi:hypothetical protein [Caballeronia sp. ATUFL_F1_KS4A]|uniref:hypothetical protein n=1 Tax=Caballeronia sp. ATUFL_F1_KS4A TaxID=2921768 RepID=UPI0020287137|nr:hypothetical protein [Caballeronia sp. ATUFL_F1_KS4A]
MQCRITVDECTVWRAVRGKGGHRIHVPVTPRLKLDTMVYRLALAKLRDNERQFVWADAWIPEHYRSRIPILDSKWIAQGVYRAKAFIDDNRKTLAPFLASGLEEMDVSEEAA